MRLLTNKNFAGDGLRVLFSLASVVVIIAGLRAAGSLIMPILLATFLAIISYPLMRLLMRIHVPRAIAVVVTVLIDCGFLVGLGFLLNYLATDLKRAIQAKYYALAIDMYHDFSNYLAQYDLQNALDGVDELLNIHQLMGYSGQLLGTAATWLSLIVLVLILMTFFLSEVDVYRRNLGRISHHGGPNFHKLLKTSEDIQRYLLIKTLISLTTGILAGLLCYFAGVDFPLLWGIVAFALNFIPTIGSIVAAIPPIILALLLVSPMAAIIVAVGYLAINMCLGNFLEPMLMGKQFGIATAVVLLSVLFWGWIWGPIGMLLAVPLTMIMKLALENSRDFKWVATLISNTKDQPEEEDGNEPRSPSLL